MVKVKICGLTRANDALLAAKLGADYLGLIFYPKSLRYLPLPKARKLSKVIRENNSKVKLVGLFVDQPIGEVNQSIKACGLGFVQLHGTESPAYCAKIVGAKVIKGFHMRSKRTIESMARYAKEKPVWALLLDSYTKGISGGTGKRFDWGLAKQAKKYRKPLFLAGGISADNIKAAIRSVKPFAVDLCSSVEDRAGIKNQKKLIKLFGSFNK